MLTIAPPPPCCFSTRLTAWATRNIPRRFTAMMRSHSPAAMSRKALRRDVPLVADIPGDAGDLAVPPEARDGSVHLGGVQPGDEHPGLLRQEPLGGSQPDAAAAATDQYPPPG